MAVVIYQVTNEDDISTDMYGCNEMNNFYKILNSRIYQNESIELSRRLITYCRKIKRPLNEKLNSNENKLTDSDDAICDCSHYSHILVDDKIYSDVNSAYKEIFGDRSQFFYILAKKKSMRNVRIGPRSINSDGCEVQCITQDYPNAFLGKTAKSSIQLIYNKNNTENRHYGVLYINATQGVPFSTTFVVKMKLCLTRIDDFHSQLKISWEIEFGANVWSLTQNTVKSRTYQLSKEVMQQYPIILNNIFSKKDINLSIKPSSIILNEFTDELENVDEIKDDQYRISNFESYLLILIIAILILYGAILVKKNIVST